MFRGQMKPVKKGGWGKLNKQKGRLQVKERKCELTSITYNHERDMIAPC